MTGVKEGDEEEAKADADAEAFVKNWDDGEEECKGDVIDELARENYKTSMTTNLKNIMRRQQRELLTASSNLMHTGVLQDIMREKKEKPRVRDLAESSSSKRLVRPASSYALIKRSKAAEMGTTARKDPSEAKISTSASFIHV